MSNLKVLGSSSQGNGYLLTDSNGYSLIIECGIKLNEVKKACGHDMTKIVGAIVSHGHG